MKAEGDVNEVQSARDATVITIPPLFQLPGLPSAAAFMNSPG